MLILIERYVLSIEQTEHLASSLVSAHASLRYYHAVLIEHMVQSTLFLRLLPLQLLAPNPFILHRLIGCF